MQKLITAGFALLFTLSAHATIPRLAQVSDHIYRGGQPETEADYVLLARMGVRTIVNLRGDSSVGPERETAERLGIRFVNLPMSGYEYPSTETVNAALALLNDAEAGPVFIHCLHGKDRTGLIIGLYRVHYDHWPRDVAYAEMRRIGFNPALVGLTAYFWMAPESRPLAAALPESCRQALESQPS